MVTEMMSAPSLRETTDSALAGALRFLVELIAWVTVPWALWKPSWVLAIAALVVLIGVPTVFGTPGDKSGSPIVAVPGSVSIGLELMQVVAAITGSWFVLPPVFAGAATVVSIVATVLQVRRWRKLVSL